MIKKFTVIVGRLGQELDKMAGYCVVGVMILVVSNIILRQVFNKPILGTYELVGYLTALAISLALAHCAYVNGHIAVDYLADKFPKRIRLVSDIAINSMALGFWGLSAIHLGKYGQSLLENGVVSPTSQIPVYPIVFAIGLSFVPLALVGLVKLSHSFGTLLTEVNSLVLNRQLELIEHKEGVR